MLACSLALLPIAATAAALTLLLCCVALSLSQGVPITAQLVEELAKSHSDRLFFDHQKNAERLAEANRVGELGRKEEMKRIFGIEI